MDELKAPLKARSAVPLDPNEKHRHGRGDWFNLLVVASAPLLINLVWLLVPLRTNLSESKCDPDDQNLLLESLYQALYTFVSSESSWCVTFALPLPPRWVQMGVNTIAGVLSGSALYLLAQHGGSSLAVKVVTNIGCTCGPALLTEFIWLRHRRASQTMPAGELGPRAMSESAGFLWTTALVAVIIAFYAWSSFILGVLKAYDSWQSPFFLPMCFVTGLWVIRLAGKRVAAKLSAFISERPVANLDVDAQTPFLYVELTHQFFFFVFYRQLFFNVEDVMYMAILQLNAMAVDLASALSIFRFSSIVCEEECVVFKMAHEHLKRQGDQLAIRQLARVVSFVAVVGLSAVVHVGYNSCFYPSKLSDRDGSLFRQMELNFGLMMLWEGLFVWVLSRMLRVMLHVDLWAYARALGNKRWFVRLTIPAAAHYISDVYFGLHNSGT